MNRLKNSKMSHFIQKIAVESEPGLTGKQLLLTNEDLKPVEPARREWRGRNFGKHPSDMCLPTMLTTFKSPFG
jgi:NCS1 family nucleobase:cation symporter-1